MHYLCMSCLWYHEESQLVADKISGILSCPNCGHDDLIEEANNE